MQSAHDLPECAAYNVDPTSKRLSWLAVSSGSRPTSQILLCCELSEETIFSLVGLGIGCTGGSPLLKIHSLHVFHRTPYKAHK